MKLTVDPDNCIGCRLCKDVCDAAFTMRDGVSTPVDEAVTEENRVCIEDAVAVCPTEAITLSEEG